MGLVIFNQFPDIIIRIGVSIIIGSGNYIFHREARLVHNSGVPEMAHRE